MQDEEYCSYSVDEILDCLPWSYGLDFVKYPNGCPPASPLVKFYRDPYPASGRWVLWREDQLRAELQSILDEWGCLDWPDAYPMLNQLVTV